MEENKQNQPTNPNLPKKSPPDLENLLKNLSNKLNFKKNAPKKDASKPSSHPPIANSRWLISLLLIIWFLSGILMVAPGKCAVVLRLGKYHDTLPAGVHWIPRFIDHSILVDIENTNKLSYQLNVFTKDAEPMIITANIEYSVADPYDFLFNTRSPLHNIQAISSSAIIQVIASFTLADLFLESDMRKLILPAQLAEKLSIENLNYKNGIKINSLALEMSPASPKLNTVFNAALNESATSKKQIALASKEQEDAIESANQKAQNLLTATNAYQKQTLLTAKTETTEYLTLLSSYKKAPEVTRTRLYYETLDSILSKNKTVLLDTPNNNIPIQLSLSKSAFAPLQKLESQEAQQKSEQSSAQPMTETSAPKEPIENETNTTIKLRSDAPERAGYP